VGEQPAAVPTVPGGQSYRVVDPAPVPAAASGLLEGLGAFVLHLLFGA
jgi:hypothetical protein